MKLGVINSDDFKSTAPAYLPVNELKIARNNEGEAVFQWRYYRRTMHALFMANTTIDLYDVEHAAIEPTATAILRKNPETGQIEIGLERYDKNDSPDDLLAELNRQLSPQLLALNSMPSQVQPAPAPSTSAESSTHTPPPDTLPTILAQLKTARKQDNRLKMGLMSQLADEVFSRSMPSPASSSTSPETQEHLLIDIDGTLIHGTNTELINDSLIAQLKAIKQRDPSTQIYLFSSMDLTSLTKSADRNFRIRLFQQLEDAGLISGVITTSDLHYTLTGQHAAGSFYRELYKPLADILYEADGKGRDLSSDQLLQSLQQLRNAIKTTQPMIAEFLERFVSGHDAEQPVDGLVRELVNGAKEQLSSPDLAYGLSGSETNFERKGTEKARLFQLFHQTYGDQIRRATLVDDSPECIAEFAETCLRYAIPFFAHNAKDYTAALELPDKSSGDDTQLISRFFVEEYAAFHTMYSALLSQDRETFQLANDQLMVVYGASSALTNKNLSRLAQEVTPADNTNIAGSEERRVGLVKKLQPSQGFMSRVTGRQRSDPESIKTALSEEQSGLEHYASYGNPIALFQLAKALTPNSMPVFHLTKDRGGRVTAFREIEPDLVASYHLAMTARGFLYKLNEPQRHQYQLMIEQLINKIQQSLQQANIDPDTAPCKEPTIRIHDLNPAELHKYVSLLQPGVQSAMQEEAVIMSSSRASPASSSTSASPVSIPPFPASSSSQQAEPADAVSISDFLDSLKAGNLAAFMEYRTRLVNKYAALSGGIKEAHENALAWITQELYLSDNLNPELIRQLFNQLELLEDIKSAVPSTQAELESGRYIASIKDVLDMSVCVLAMKESEPEKYQFIRQQIAGIQTRDDFDRVTGVLESEAYRSTRDQQYDYKESIGLPRRSNMIDAYKATEAYQRFCENNRLPTAMAFLRSNKSLPLQDKIEFIWADRLPLSNEQREKLQEVAVTHYYSDSNTLQRLGRELAYVSDVVAENVIAQARDRLVPSDFSHMLEAYRIELGADNSLENRARNTLNNRRTGLSLDTNAPRAWRVLCRDCLHKSGFNLDAESKGIMSEPRERHQPGR